ncbi:uncharacterized protein STEHIDRAFT_161640 [Stereum hirsutum FP-91666 SS1]|uniref:uncharacterized protein n=1 Tax=Stereum hirsutum (strain FP-91666) TaxID=721885 RepID=UPI000444A115|nr:uncharacterized protein STEHIDRAFT_161640 [Stereum hirsutum FP-91666 SS1]EIM81449.1 hypothetical protein STEHIDRAFT_161640 [Stereum hirsutum FP-91666 SS1]
MPVRLIGFLNRLPNVSFEDFDATWIQYGSLVSMLPAVKGGRIRYRQLHKDPHLSDRLGSTSGTMGRTIADYDGIAEWEAETLEEITAVFATDEYKKACFPLEAKFFDRPRMTVMTVSRVVEDFAAV